MELSLSSQSFLTLTKTLKLTRSHLHHHHRHFLSRPNPNFSRSIATLLLSRRLQSAIIASKSSSFGSPLSLLASVHRVPCSTAFFASGGGSGGGIGGGGGDGDGDGSGGGGSTIGGASGRVDDVSALSPDVIVLDVGGMTCGGCAASVKRILENQPQVSSASVNLATETAIVWTASEVKVGPNWQQEIGGKLANQLTSCGFQSSLRGHRDMEGNGPK